MRSGLVALLAGESTISNIVATRIYISKAPQTAPLPNIVITQMGSDELPALDSTPGLRFLDFDIDCRAERSVDSYTLGNAVRVFLDDYSGPAGSQTVGAIILNDESTDYDPPADASDKGVHTTLLDITVQYSPA